MAQFDCIFSTESSDVFDIEFQSQDNIDLLFDHVIEIDKPRDVYKGEYEVTPSIISMTSLSTSGKFLSKDVTVKELPRYDTSNTAGGITVYLGRR